MPLQRLCSFLLGTGWLVLVLPLAGGTAAPLPLVQQAEAIAARLEGVMDTTAQVAINPKAPHVRMTTCRVTLAPAAGKSMAPGGNGAIVLYQEQALTKSLDKPYRQRFLQILPRSLSQSVESRSFKPATPEAWSGFCNKPLPTRIVQVKELGIPICSVFLRQVGDDYVGNTPADGCPANVRGAVRITNHIFLHATGMDTWDRGFDASGKQVWGAKAESYQFRRLAP